jgi:PhnB protein
MTEQTTQLYDKAMERGVIPYITLSGVSDASAFYQKAFGARELMRMPSENGKTLMHCRLEINGGLLMMTDAMPERGFDWRPSHSYTMQLIVDDIDAWFKRAIDAGATVEMPVQTMFWGDRWGSLKDPFGVNWAMNENAK